MAKRPKRRPLRDHQFTVRIPAKYLEQLKITAEQERRSVSDVLNILLEQRYADRKPK